MKIIELNVFRNLTDTKFDSYVFKTPEEMVNALKDHGVASLERKEDGELCIFGHFKDKSKGRRKDNLQYTNVLVLDIDTTTDTEIKKALAILTLYCFIAYETYSSTKESPRWRIIVILDEEVSCQDFSKKKIASALADILGIKEIDNVSNNPVQPYFFPYTPPGQTRELICNETGKCFPLNKLLNHKIKATKSKAHSKNDKGKPWGDEADTKVALDLVKTDFDDNLIFFKNRHYFYDAGYWQVVSQEAILQHILLDSFDKNIAVHDGEKIVKAIEAVKYVEKFPEPDKILGDLVVLRNCVVNPATGETHAHAVEHYARNRLDFDYDPAAACDLWLKFLDDVFASDSDKKKKIMLLQEFIGLSLTRCNSFQKSLWLVGPGANGKSVIISVVQNLIGKDNYSTVPISNFSGRFSVIDMEDKLANFDADMSINSKIDDGKIKPIISGDKITVEQKFKNAYHTHMVAKLWVAANDLPDTKDTSHGLFRRIMILTFNRIFKEDEQDHQLTEKLLLELPGIFNWALIGLQRLLRKHKFTHPKSVTEALEDYKNSSDPVRQFKADHLVQIDISQRLKDGMLMYDIYRAFQVYCKANGISPIPDSKKLGGQLRQLGIDKRGSGGKRYYPVKLKNMDHFNKYQLANLEDQFN